MYVLLLALYMHGASARITLHAPWIALTQMYMYMYSNACVMENAQSFSAFWYQFPAWVTRTG